MSCVGTNMLSAIQKLFGYGKASSSKKKDVTDHYMDLYWKFLADLQHDSKSDYERQLEDLANYHKIMKTFVRSQSCETNSELIEVLNVEESCFKVAKWLQDCDKVSRNEMELPAADTDLHLPNNNVHPGLHYACVRVPTLAEEESATSHVYAEIPEINSPRVDKKPPRGRSKSVSKVGRSQSCKRSNSFVQLGPELREALPPAVPSRKSRSNVDIQNKDGRSQRPRAASQSRRRSRVDSSSSWEVTRRPRQINPDSMWV